MTLLKQNSKLITNSNINQWGCRFMSLLAIVQLYQGNELSANQILSVYNEAIQDSDIMFSNCLCGKKEHAITKLGFAQMGVNNVAIQAGVREKDINKDWQGYPIIDKGENRIFTMMKWKNVGGNHFTLGDVNGKEIYDPWDYSLINISLKDSLLTTYVYVVRD